MAKSMVERATTPSMRFDGAVAVVTGAGRGLGQGCAFALADAGADVVLVSRTYEELEQTAEGDSRCRWQGYSPALRRDGPKPG